VQTQQKEKGYKFRPFKLFHGNYEKMANNRISINYNTPGSLLSLSISPLQPPLANDTGWTQEGVQEVVNANNKFALKLYSQIAKSETGNIFYSPYSIFSALTITYEGAREETAEEMKNVLHLPETSILRPNFARIYNEINKRTNDYELRTGNALWLQKDYPFIEDYKKVVERYYGGKATNLDFVNEPEKSREIINKFIAEQTNNKIQEIIPPGSIDATTRLVITNAIYFKGTWEYQFDKSATQLDDFRVSENKTVKVEMMHIDNAKLNYADLGDLEILELPYKGGNISMLILLPRGDLKSIETNLTTENISQYRNLMKETEVSVYLPKFSFTTQYFLNDVLKSLGIEKGFDPTQANFSGMSTAITPEQRLYISQVIHKAYIKVDEEGTEAAAATAVVINVGSVHHPVFRADHPFIFIIQERNTGNILFMGRVVDPTAR
jgi:serpin B